MVASYMGDRPRKLPSVTCRRSVPATLFNRIAAVQLIEGVVLRPKSVIIVPVLA